MCHASSPARYFQACLRTWRAQPAPHSGRGTLWTVLASAAPGEELDLVEAITKRLTQEHRMIEALWKGMESGLKRVAKGQSTDLNVAEIQRLVSEYTAHANYEETEFLPLSEKILSRNSNHMAALSLSLHMRHVKATPLI